MNSCPGYWVIPALCPGYAMYILEIDAGYAVDDTCMLAGYRPDRYGFPVRSEGKNKYKGYWR
jgi:hypothetical protein